MQLIEVGSYQDQRRFNEVPRALYKDDEEFVSSLDVDINTLFDSKKNLLLKNGNASRWILKEGTKLIGRIAAFHNEDFSLSGIGFFDCIHDQKAALLLFDEAESWLKNEGCDRIEAPINFGERDKFWGLLVDGFKRPSYQENYNYPYYQQLFETAGYVQSFKQTTSEVDLMVFDPARFERVAKRFFSNAQYHVVHFDSTKLRKFAQDFVTIYNAAWAHREFFITLRVERVEDLFKTMKPILRDDLVWFAYLHDRPIAFYVSVIDVNQLFKHLHGKTDWWAKLKFLYYRKVIKVDRIRGIAFGVVPEFQDKGLISLLIMKMYEVLKKDTAIKSTELSWIGDFNPKMHSLFFRLGAQKTKTHYTYEKHL